MLAESRLLLALASFALLVGCDPVSTGVGAAATVTNMAMEERGFRASVDDDLIWVSINKRLLDYDFAVFRTVNLQVQQGRVVLTGSVPVPQDRIAATRLSWQTGGVREVHNMLVVGEGRDLGTAAHDALLTKKLELKLYVDADIFAQNFSVDAIEGVIYVIGIAQDAAERQRVIDHARDIPYVKNVVSYIRLRDDPLPEEPDRQERDRLATGATAQP
ncbi:MAG TPA: BON domain-containing protein [Dongiaceae bacterium]|jgi:osmotically-inducible protein OsmY|nr:BON domain-containing protein [Dongiaceae bacterium]